MGENKTVLKLLLLWLLISTYVLLHEGGHALTAYLSGVRITYFSINLFNARMAYSGSLTAFQKSIFHIAGFGLPYFIWLLLISFVPVNSGKRVIEYLKVYSAVVMASAIPWITIPVLYLTGSAPAGDDTTKFLKTSSLNGLLVSLFFLCLLVFSFLLWRKKTPDARAIFFAREAPFKMKKGLLIALVVLALAFIFLMTFPWIDRKPQLGEEYQLLCHAELEGLEGQWEICKFWVEEDRASEEINILIVGKDVSARMLQLELSGSNGEIVTFARSRDFTSSTIRYKKELELKSGEYRFMLNAEEIKGDLYVYLHRSSTNN